MEEGRHYPSVQRECESVPRWFWVCACGVEATLNFADPDQAWADGSLHARSMESTWPQPAAQTETDSQAETSARPEIAA